MLAKDRNDALAAINRNSDQGNPIAREEKLGDWGIGQNKDESEASVIEAVSGMHDSIYAKVAFPLGR